MPKGVGRPNNRKEKEDHASWVNSGVLDKDTVDFINENKSNFRNYPKDTFRSKTRERRPGTENMPVGKADKNAGIRSMKRTQVTPGKWKTNG